ncbi:hypothetical protein POM88_019145 [Heracleum sosnowskyi]|uniref:Uncharacterized protein n=1 Tax=Heracleum sosnowskyi TaxID=360622 RepID=A0AAD8IRT3_9APIA|nr:hypothetical protein POM88_019145 [Heracleum sosnowskyi]
MKAYIRWKRSFNNQVKLEATLSSDVCNHKWYFTLQRSQILYESPSECTHPSSSALALGLIAVVWTVALFCSVVSWFTFVTAVLILLSGAALNDENSEESKYQGHYSCYVLKRGVFAAAAILSLATVVLGILSFVMVQSAQNRGDSWARPAAAVQSIAMGQAFVQEDTYMRTLRVGRNILRSSHEKCLFYRLTVFLFKIIRYKFAVTQNNPI